MVCFRLCLCKVGGPIIEWKRDLKQSLMGAKLGKVLFTDPTLPEIKNKGLQLPQEKGSKMATWIGRKLKSWGGGRGLGAHVLHDNGVEVVAQTGRQDKDALEPNR